MRAPVLWVGAEVGCADSAKLDNAVADLHWVSSSAPEAFAWQRRHTEFPDRVSQKSASPRAKQLSAAPISFRVPFSKRRMFVCEQRRSRAASVTPMVLDSSVTIKSSFPWVFAFYGLR